MNEMRSLQNAAVIGAGQNQAQQSGADDMQGALGRVRDVAYQLRTLADKIEGPKPQPAPDIGKISATYSLAEVIERVPTDLRNACDDCADTIGRIKTLLRL